MKQLFLSLLLLSMVACQPKDPLLTVLEESSDPIIKKVVADIATYELQIIYTQIDSTKNGLSFTDYTYGWQQGQYFICMVVVHLEL